MNNPKKGGNLSWARFWGMGHRDSTSVVQEPECSSETEHVFSVYEALGSTHETKPEENKIKK